MKTVIVFLLGFFVAHNPTLRRQIITDSYNYNFYVSFKPYKKCNSNKVYTWFKSGDLHTSLGEYDGALLDGIYTKSYVSNNLAEKGSYKSGLKEGVWTEWYEGGKQKTISNWKKGILVGEVKSFSETGKLLLKGKYVKGKKQGTWVDFVKKDTLFYKKGVKRLSKKESLNKKDKLSLAVRAKNYLKKVFGKLKGKKKATKKRNNKRKATKKKQIKDKPKKSTKSKANRRRK